MDSEQQRRLGDNGQLVTPLDEFRASKSVFTILSGANPYVSGVAIYTIVASSVVIGRPLKIHLFNRESSHATVIFRDGGITGTVFAGPYKINPVSERTITRDELVGGRFTSGIYAVVISGPAFSQGIITDVGYLLEPNPTHPGGGLE